ncbi:MAG: hypothetical protein JW725_00930 [Candidatus Babeliaceae bacterium]|nr:hypothetical protein [Candidatus Babeliaceae bacterium]
MKLSFKDLLQVYLVPIIVVIAALIAVYLFLGSSTWQDFLPNFLATMLGAIVGIPIAISINNQQEAKKDRIQKDKIVPLLREELLVDFGHLASWQKSNFQKLETVYTGIFLEDSAWKAFSDSGELAFIKDPELLKKISHAYSSMSILKLLSERYMDLAHLPDQKERDLLQAPVAYLISKGIDSALEDVSAALKSIK